MVFERMDSSSTESECCYICKGKVFWNMGWGWICQRCHPCPDPEEAEWLEIDNQE